MSEHIINTTDDNFKSDVLAGVTHATVLNELADEYAGKLKIVKVDVTTAEATAVNYNIRNIPALLLFKNGEVVAQQVGAAPRSKLVEFIDSNI